MFNWQRFFIEQWPVEIISLSKTQDLARLKLPWYLEADAGS